MTLREADIRPAALLNEYLRLSTEDAREMAGTPGALADRTCPGCGGREQRPAFEKNGFSLVHCGDCRTLYVSPAPTAEALANFYRDSASANYWASVFFPAVAEARRTGIFAPRAARVASLIDAYATGTRGGELFDVGAGAGLFLEEFRAASPETPVAAIEPGRLHVENLKSQSMRVFEGYADEAANDPAWAGVAGCVTCFEVIEHIPDTAGFLASLRQLACPGGLVILSGLSGDGFDIKALGVHSKAVSPPHHLTFLSLDGVKAALKRADLELVDLFTPGELDVDIVRNAVLEDPSCIDDASLRARVLDEDSAARGALQEELKENMQSSHMWIVARRPMADGGAA